MLKSLSNARSAGQAALLHCKEVYICRIGKAVKKELQMVATIQGLRNEILKLRDSFEKMMGGIQACKDANAQLAMSGMALQILQLIEDVNRSILLLEAVERN
ncbi:MAG: hypothetical protein ABJA60_05000 [Nitrosospira sp.]